MTEVEQVATMPSFKEVFGFAEDAPIPQSVLEAEMAIATGIILDEHSRAVARKIECVTALNTAAGRVECESAMDDLTVAEKALDAARIRKDAAECHIAEMFGEERRHEFMDRVEGLRS